MPINISCEYECDQCATKVDGLVGKLPTDWLEGFGDDVAAANLNTKGPVVFDTQDCRDQFLAALITAQGG